MASRKGEFTREQLTTAVAAVILATWTVSFIVGLLNENYHAPPVLTPLMLAVAGFAFSDGIVSRRKPAPKETEE